MGFEFSKEPSILRILKTPYEDCNRQTPSGEDIELEQMTVSKNMDSASYNIRFTVLHNTKTEYYINLIRWATYDYETVPDLVIETTFIDNGEKFSRVYLLDDLWLEGEDYERIIYGAKCRHTILNKLEPDVFDTYKQGMILDDRAKRLAYDWIKKTVEEDSMPVARVNTIDGKIIAKVDRTITTGIDKIVFNDPATIVYWIDGTKTVVKASEHDKFDKETGLAMALVKKFLECRGSKNPRGEFKRLVREADDYSSKR